MLGIGNFVVLELEWNREIGFWCLELVSLVYLVNVKLVREFVFNKVCVYGSFLEIV